MTSILKIKGYQIDLNSKLIGRGKFGFVLKAINPQKQIVCAKIINIKHYEDDLLKKEVDVLTALAKKNHKNLTQIYDILFTAFSEQQYCIIFMEYVVGGDLQTAMEKRIQDKKWFPLYQIIKIMMDLLQGLQELYNRKIIHRDLKPANILMGDDNKITDFGTGRILEDMQKQQFLTRKGSPVYSSPQILDEQPFSAKKDIYSLGIIFYQLAFQGCFPYGNLQVSLESHRKFISDLRKKTFVVPIILGADGERLELFRDLIQKMISYNENERPDLNELMSHPLFTVNKKIQPMNFLFQAHQPNISDTQLIIDTLLFDQNDPKFINIKQFSLCTEEMFSQLNPQNKIYHILKLIIAKSFFAEFVGQLLEQFTTFPEIPIMLYLKTSINGYRANLLTNAYAFSQGIIQYICPKIRSIYNLEKIEMAIQKFIGDLNFQNMKSQIKGLAEYYIPQFCSQVEYVIFILRQEQNNFYQNFYQIIQIREQTSYTIYHKWFVELGNRTFQNYQFSTPFEYKLKAALEYLLYLEQKFPIQDYFKQNPNHILQAIEQISNQQ